MKSVRIRSFSGTHFHAFGLNAERYGVSLHIQTKCGKYGPEKLWIRTLFTQWEVDISIFSGYSILCWHAVKHSCDFVPVSIFNLQQECFVRLWSWIVLFPSKQLWQVAILRMNFLFFLFIHFYVHINCFLQHHQCAYKTLTLKTNSWFLQFYTAMTHLELCKINIVCFT